MASNFTDAVKEMHAKMERAAAPQLIITAPENTVSPQQMFDTIKATNTELVRWIRNNPQVLVK